MEIEMLLLKVYLNNSIQLKNKNNHLHLQHSCFDYMDQKGGCFALTKATLTMIVKNLWKTLKCTTNVCKQVGKEEIKSWMSNFASNPRSHNESSSCQNDRRI